MEGLKDDLRFWKIRSERFNKLDWARNKFYLGLLTEVVNFNKNDVVLDVGTGTGIVADVVSLLVKKVIGLDISQDMVDHSKWDGNKIFDMHINSSEIFKRHYNMSITNNDCLIDFKHLILVGDKLK